MAPPRARPGGSAHGHLRGPGYLTAIQGVRDDIEYTMQTGGVTRGVATSVNQMWSWRPSLTRTQQVERTVGPSARTV